MLIIIISDIVLIMYCLNVLQPVLVYFTLLESWHFWTNKALIMYTWLSRYLYYVLASRSNKSNAYN